MKTVLIALAAVLALSVAAEAKGPGKIQWAKAPSSWSIAGKTLHNP